MILCVTLALLAVASAQTTLTKLITIGTALSAPAGGVVVRGSNGQRYLWLPDHLQGICKVTPSIDVTAPGTVFTITSSNCILSVGGALAIKPGQLSFDPVGNFFYAADLTTKTPSIVRLTYSPTQNGGTGGISAGTTLLGTCSTIVGNKPNAVAWNSIDKSLYIVYLKVNQITRLANAGANPTCADNVVVGTVADRRKGLSIAFLGADLWEVDGTGLAYIPNAAVTCSAANKCNGIPRFAGQIVLPQVLNTEPSTGLVYVGGPTNMYRLDPVANSVTILATTFQNIFGVTAASPLTVGGTPTVFVTDDISAGAIPFQGTLSKLS